LTAPHRIEEGRRVLRRLSLALLALLLVLPASAAAAPRRGQDIRKVQAVTTSAGALVRVTLRARLDGPIAVHFRRWQGRGSARSSTVAYSGRRVSFVFSGDTRNLSRVIVRTSSDRTTLRLPRRVDNCAALTRLARSLRPLRAGRPAIKRRLRAIANHRADCSAGPLPALPVPPAAPGFAAPVARYSLQHGLTPEDPLEGGDDVAFTDASGGSELVSWAWDFGDGARASGPFAKHAFAPGRYTTILTVANSRGDVNAFGQLLFVRGAGFTTVDAAPVACPGPGETVPVTVSMFVPSWAENPNVSYAIPAGPCGASASIARDLTLTPGKRGDRRDAWGRPSSTLSFTFDLSGGTGTGTVTPNVTASWS
jgi:hypothetical protein